jgi:hypothetical protein
MGFAEGFKIKLALDFRPSFFVLRKCSGRTRESQLETGGAALFHTAGIHMEAGSSDLASEKPQDRRSRGGPYPAPLIRAIIL